MRFATVHADGGRLEVALRDGRYVPLATGDPQLNAVRGIAASGATGVTRVAAWVDAQPEHAWHSLEAIEGYGPPLEPPAIYTVGHNYRVVGEAAGSGPERPLVYGKAASSVAGHGGVLSWDRGLTANVDPECELGVVIGTPAWQVAPGDAMGHVFGYTVINDVSSRDPWLDGDQWLLGKSMPGFCPVGPWIVTADELDPADLRLGCTITDAPIQDGRTADMRFTIPEIVAYLSRHAVLRPGDLIATGTPVRLAAAPGPDRHLQAGDVVTAWIQGIGELTTTIA